MGLDRLNGLLSLHHPLFLACMGSVSHMMMIHSKANYLGIMLSFCQARHLPCFQSGLLSCAYCAGTDMKKHFSTLSRFQVMTAQIIQSSSAWAISPGGFSTTVLHMPSIGLSRLVSVRTCSAVIELSLNSNLALPWLPLPGHYLLQVVFAFEH